MVIAGGRSARRGLSGERPRRHGEGSLRGVLGEHRRQASRSLHGVGTQALQAAVKGKGAWQASDEDGGSGHDARMAKDGTRMGRSQTLARRICRRLDCPRGRDRHRRSTQAIRVDQHANRRPLFAEEACDRNPRDRDAGSHLLRDGCIGASCGADRDSVAWQPRGHVGRWPRLTSSKQGQGWLG